MRRLCSVNTLAYSSSLFCSAFAFYSRPFFSAFASSSYFSFSNFASFSCSYCVAARASFLSYSFCYFLWPVRVWWCLRRSSLSNFCLHATQYMIYFTGFTCLFFLWSLYSHWLLKVRLHAGSWHLTSILPLQLF